MEKLSKNNVLEQSLDAITDGVNCIKNGLTNLANKTRKATTFVVESLSPEERATRAIPINPKYQSLSITVPGGCPNNCKFCVSHMHEEEGIPKLLKSAKKREELKQDVIDRLVWAKERGTDTLVLTGASSEPAVQVAFLNYIKDINNSLPSPFRRIEIQTSGVGLSDERLKLLKEMRVKTIALSLSSLDSLENAEINGTPKKLLVNIDQLTKKVREDGFNLRLCLNLNEAFNKYFSNGVDDFFEKCKKLGADQITFRTLYTSGKNTPQDQWIESHMFDPEILEKIYQYIKTEGSPKDRLPFGAIVYTIKKSIATIIDDDCMNSKSKTVSGIQKYCILREDGRLYYDWADAGTLIL